MTGSAPADALTLVHGELHAWLENRVFLVLEALVQREIGAARRRWLGFVDVLAAHMRLEDERVVPAYRALFLAAARPDGPGRPDHVEGDHTILLRHVEAIDALFEHLEDDTPLRAILEVLPTFYRLTGTLEHHTMRENTHVYPALARALPPAELDDVIGALRALVERARGT